jgi:hypothetical protein
MAEPRKTDWLVPLFFGFALAAILPPVVVFTLFKPFGASVLSAGWLALVAVVVVAFQSTRLRTRLGDPGADIAAASLGLTFDKDRILEGTIDGVAVRALELGRGLRIEARVREQGPDPDESAWFASLSPETRTGMTEAVASGELTVVDRWLVVAAPLSFRDPTHGEELTFRIRDLVRIARVLTAGGPPPNRCVERLLEERRNLAAGSAGTLSIAEQSGQGAVSIAARAGALTLPKKS